ncbi:MAG: methyltransferase domain-containing protein [Acidobacteria bacterium]|nr:methyltransferase domain-containing protein [Acidobacteriota bacterium]
MFVCPDCRSGLAEDAGPSIRCECGREYPRLPSRGLDFLPGRKLRDFEIDPSDAGQRAHLEEEAAGVSWRVDRLILPLVVRYCSALGLDPGSIRLLDCGCGGGASIDALRSRGFRAVGIDAGRSRQEQWRERSFGEHLHSANALELPFAGRTFDAVISSGLIEHIGIQEAETGRYAARRLPDCQPQRLRFIRELARVLTADGFILLDHPNGRFPVDFWHGGRAGSFRWHGLQGDMLPTFREIALYFRLSDPALRLWSLSPAQRLRFNQVRHHWYGRLFAPVMKAWLSLLGTGPLSPLARSFLNPYLVTIASRARNAADWIPP